MTKYSHILCLSSILLIAFISSRSFGQASTLVKRITAACVVVLLGRKFGRACLVISSLTCLAIPALAASKTWDANGLSPPSGVFNIAANWNVNGVPTNLDSALFSNAQNYTVVFDNSPTNNDLT